MIIRELPPTCMPYTYKPKACLSWNCWGQLIDLHAYTSERFGLRGLFTFSTARNVKLLPPWSMCKARYLSGRLGHCDLKNRPLYLLMNIT
ncbi:hypothetical protein CEXT_562371 [Caerostris extrusa]|uniref:Uncharacterized protein n=1 Tax=Caerostris extrusa TaxID=172846 RepID=A0AAV4PS17_CAEEX|nr:hypothetical protein CEXT_562371 [Caerostris extrusa]